MIVRDLSCCQRCCWRFRSVRDVTACRLRNSDPETVVPGSSGSGIVPLFLDRLTLKMHCLGLQDQALSHSSWTAWPWSCTAWIFRIRHCPTLLGPLDPEEVLPRSSGSGIVPFFLDRLTLKMHCLDLQNQALSHSSWTAWPWICTAWIFRIRHCPTLPGPPDTKMHCLDLQNQALSHSSWNAWPWRCRYYYVPNVGKQLPVDTV
jgi:hypothetical protein